MTAPPGQAATRLGLVRRGLIPLVLGLAAGGLFLGLIVAGFRLPFSYFPFSTQLVLVAVAGAIAFVVSAGLVPVELEGSHWRIPRIWGRHGSRWHSFTFGVGLGSGFMTALPSPCAYYVLLGLFASQTLTQVAVVIALFEVGRFLPTALVCISAAFGDGDEVDPLRAHDILNAYLRRFPWLAVLESAFVIAGVLTLLQFW